jgi:hypothetical protein
MATMNFSLPDELKARFDAAFVGENKSAVLAGLLDEAIERKRRAAERQAAFDHFMEYRKTLPPVTTNLTEALRESRDEATTPIDRQAEPA